MSTLAGKTILMSGGSRGIGLAIALRAARDGANIAMLAKTDTPHPKLEGTVHSAAEQIRAAGGQALPIVGDVRDDDDITEAVLKTQGEFGGIDIVINNASVIDLSRSLELGAKKYDLMQDVNVRGTFMLSRAAVPILKDAENPHILSLSPPLNPTPKWLGAHTGYTLAKFGMTMVTLGLAAEFARDGANIAMLAKTDTPHPKLEGTVHTAAEQIRAAGGQALPIVGDVRDDDDITEAVLKTQGEFGGIDIVINNASVIDLSRSLDLGPKKYDLMQDVNVRGTFMLSRAAVPALKDAVNPHILSLSPPLNPSPKWLGAHTGYTLAKFGMTMVTLGLAAEFARDGIAANTLWPRTTIATAAVQNLLGGDKVMGASRSPEIYADAAYAVLCQPAVSYTGQTLIVEDVLEAAGITDFSAYAAIPGTPDERLFPDIFLD